MAKYLPPASVLYWPSAPILWSMPTPAHSQNPTILIYHLLPASGNTWFYTTASSANFYMLAQFHLLTPGNYIVEMEDTQPMNNVRFLLNGSVIYQPTNEGVTNLKLTLKKVPGNSTLEIWVYLSSTVFHNFRNIKLWAGENAIVYGRQLLTVTAGTYSGSPTTSQTEQDLQANMPPPERSVSNIPVKRKGSYLIY